MRNATTKVKGLSRRRRRRSDGPYAHKTFEVNIDEVMADLEFPRPVRWML